MIREYQEENVYEALQKRLRLIFEGLFLVVQQA